MNKVKLEELNEHFLCIEKQKTIKINGIIFKTASKLNNFMDKYHISTFLGMAILSIICSKLFHISIEYSFLFYGVFMLTILIPLLVYSGINKYVIAYNKKAFYCLPADKDTMVKFVAMYDDVNKAYLECIFLNNNNVISYNIILNELNKNMGLLQSKLKKEKTKEIIESLKNTKHDT